MSKRCGAKKSSIDMVRPSKGKGAMAQRLSVANDWATAGLVGYPRSECGWLIHMIGVAQLGVRGSLPLEWGRDTRNHSICFGAYAAWKRWRA